MIGAPLFHITGSGHSGRIAELMGTMTIGCIADNDIVLDDDTVSQCHAMLLIQPEGVLLLDLESTNGTFVNGVPAIPEEMARLRDGDRVTIGRMVLRCEVPPRR